MSTTALTPTPSATPDSLIRGGRSGIQGSIATGIVTFFLSLTGLHLTVAAIGGLITVVTALVSFAQNYLEDHKGLPALFYGTRGTAASKDSATANTQDIPPGPTLKAAVAAVTTVVPVIGAPAPVPAPEPVVNPLAPPEAPVIPTVVDPAPPAPPAEPFTPYY